MRTFFKAICAAAVLGCAFLCAPPATAPANHTPAPALAVASEPSAQALNPALRATVEIYADYGDHAEGGTGYFISSNYIVTNCHVVCGSRRIQVTNYDRSINRLSARLLYSDREKDIAVLRVSVPARANITPLVLDSSVQVGDQVIAIGNPSNGHRFTVTYGRVLVADLRYMPIPADAPNGMIESDVSIYFGNSGGPLLMQRDDAYVVAGMVTEMSAEPDAQGHRFAFAIPAKTIVQFLADHGINLNVS